MADVTRNNKEWNVEISPGENISLATAQTYVDGDIKIKGKEETDPIFSASPAALITDENIASWNKCTTIGTSISKIGSSSTNLTTNTWTTVATTSTTSSGGSFLVIAMVLFSAATGGRRGVRIKQGANAALTQATQVVAGNTNGSATYYIQASWVFDVNEATNFSVEAWTSVACAPTNSYIKVTRLK